MFEKVARALSLIVLSALQVACEDKGDISRKFAKAHVHVLVETTQQDVEEVRKGLPEGAKLLASLYEDDKDPADDRKAVREALERTRSKVQDLRVAKATFFALVDDNGRVLRNDQEQDLMADRNAFKPFPELKKVFEGKYVETRGYMPEARGVAEPRPDGQWVAGAPVEARGDVQGAYIAGWAWSSYALRLEFKLRGQIRSKLLQEDDSRKNEALAYVYLVVGEQVIGAPASPEVNMKTLRELDLLGKLGGETHDQELDVTGRTFGLAVERAPALGKEVAVAVLRSET